MFDELKKKLQYQTHKKSIEKSRQPSGKADSKEAKPGLPTSLRENLSEIRKMTHNSNDVIVREFSFGHEQKINAAMVFVDGLVNNSIINENIIEPLMYKMGTLDLDEFLLTKDFSIIQRCVLSVSEVNVINTMDALASAFINGETVLLVEGLDRGLSVNTKGWERRSVSEPATDSVIRGPREAFTENLRTNTALIRRRIKSPALTMETMVAGEKTKTIISIAYLSGVANDEVIEEVKSRIACINTDAILESGYVQQYIEDAPLSIFPTMGYSEKPDVIAAKMLEGRVAILVDGTPFVLTAPFLLIENFQTAEDYYSHPYFMSLLRIVRVIALLISILAPAIYVGITTFHQELIPTKLLFTMVAARENIPFPAVAEAGIMLVVFEILREAGVRLPRPVGQAMSIVGALVMGDAAVSAGLIGAPMVIVIAITAVSIFAVASLMDSATLIRLFLLVLAGCMGGFGIAMGLILVAAHVASLRSFGFPYMSPIAPVRFRDLKDSLVRFPLWMMRHRPTNMAKNDDVRQGDFRTTAPPGQESPKAQK